jgi:hypothetical protein
MVVSRISTLTGKFHQVELPVTPEQLTAWEGGQLVQRVFPHLTADEREFIMSGITPEEWDAEFGVEAE